MGGEGAFYFVHDFGQGGRLGYEIVEFRFEAAFDGVLVRDGTVSDYFSPLSAVCPLQLPDQLCRFNPVHPIHPDVHQDDVKFSISPCPDGIFTAGRALGFQVPLLLEQIRRQLANDGIILNNQDLAFRLFRHSGAPMKGMGLEAFDLLNKIVGKFQGIREFHPKTGEVEGKLPAI
jgi:hypothetical protein